MSKLLLFTVLFTLVLALVLALVFTLLFTLLFTARKRVMLERLLAVDAQALLISGAGTRTLFVTLHGSTVQPLLGLPDRVSVCLFLCCAAV